MSACPAEEALAELVEGRLASPAAADLHKHVRGCGKCRVVLAGLADSFSEEPPEGRTLELGTRLREGDSGPVSVRYDIGARVGRFVIERLIGLGGMGAVYAAKDPELGREVALKLLRVGGSHAHDAAARRSRLLREAQSMARLSHPNVVTVYQVGEFEDRLFVVMELVEGSNLSQWLRETPRSVDEIMDAFVAAGRGLSAAHAAGIVHRDFKPDNVLVGADGRVRVTDFGLARAVVEEEEAEAPLPPPDGDVAADSSLTPMGALVGTPAYMAPEQMTAQPVDARADVFSFCTSFYEALYGMRPFGAATLYELKRRIEAGDVEPPARGRVVPGWLRRELLKGLQAAPARRHASIDELLKAIAVGRAKAARRRTAFRAAAGAAVLAALAGAALALWPVPPRNDAGVRHRRSVAVLGPRNLAARADAAWLSGALSEMLGTEVGADGALRLVAAEHVARAVQDVDLQPGAPQRDAVQRLRQAVGADLVVTGSYMVTAGGQIRVDLRVLDAATGEATASIVETGEQERLLELVARAGAQLRRSLGGDPLALTHAAQATFPAHPEAARLYAAGLEHLRAFDHAAAVQSLSRAAELAPDNPRILGALSDALLALGRLREAGEAARKAFEFSGNLGRDERLRTELTYRHTVKDFARAAEIARALFVFSPDDIDSGLKLAEEQLAGHMVNEALETVAALRKLPAPQRADPRIDLIEAEAAGLRGEQKRAADLAQRAIDAARKSGLRWLLARGLYLAGEARRLQGDHAAARTFYASAGEQFRTVHDKGGEAKAATMAATVLADEGDLPGAAREFEAALATFHALGNRRSAAALEHNLSIVFRRLRSLPQALEHSLRAKELNNELAAEPAQLASTLLTAGHIRQDLGDLKGAMASIRQAVDLRRKVQHRQLATALTALGELKLLQGDVDGGRRSFDEALRLAKQDDLVQRGDAIAGQGQAAFAAGDAATAASKLRDAARMLTERGRRDEAALVESRLAGALLALGKNEEARAAVERAQALMARSQSLLARGSIGIAAARVKAALSPSDVEAAARDVEAVRAEAARYGVAEDQLEARLALLELRPAGAPGRGEQLRALARDARSLGFELLARNADGLARR